MSKCQIGKYRPGGRCGGHAGGDSGSGVKKDAGSLGGAFAALLAAREQLDAAVVAPCSSTAAAPAPAARAAAPAPAAKTAITLFTPSKKGDAQRKADIDLILED